MPFDLVSAFQSLTPEHEDPDFRVGLGYGFRVVEVPCFLPCRHGHVDPFQHAGSKLSLLNAQAVLRARLPGKHLRRKRNRDQ